MAESSPPAVSETPCQHAWVITSERCALCGQQESRNGGPSDTLTRARAEARLKQAQFEDGYVDHLLNILFPAHDGSR